MSPFEGWSLVLYSVIATIMASAILTDATTLLLLSVVCICRSFCFDVYFWCLFGHESGFGTGQDIYYHFLFIILRPKRSTEMNES